jgi:hypothetical protein
MNQNQEELWKKLQSYVFDDPNSKHPFSLKLAKENHWSPKFTARVIEEYRRFLLLLATAGHLVVPSDEIDQTWHTHILYTQEYFENFCPNVIGKPLHHGPSKGGDHEDNRHTNWYEKSKETYKNVFGEGPPEDIWPNSHIRFKERFMRVNVHTNIIIKKDAHPVVSALVIPLLKFVRRFRKPVKNAA